MNEQKKLEVLAFFWFVVSALTLLALLSYTPADIPFEVSVVNSPAKNFVGIAGAYIAWAMILLFGKTAYFLVPLSLFWSIAKWAGKKSQRLWLKLFAVIIFFTSACALFSQIYQDNEIHRFQSGGLIGFFVSGFLNGLFGNAGIFVALSLFCLSILLASEMLLLQMALGVFSKLKDWFALSVLKKQVTSKEKPSSIVQAVFPEPKKIFSEPSKPQIKIASTGSEVVKPQIRISVPKPAEGKPKPAEAIEETPVGDYHLPSLDLLERPLIIDQSKAQNDLETSSRVLEETLRDFGIDAKVEEVEQGPTITRYELQPAAGVKVGRITSLENDIALAMRATSVRIIAPIPGKSRVGIEVPNNKLSTVYIREVLESGEYRGETSKISVVLGKDTAGAPLVCNLSDMPHLLIAGATNTGKSVCINTLITSILFKATPEEVKFIMIDPKMVELHFYNDLPHLVCPVVTDKTKAPGVLEWLVSEMDRRYRVLSKVGARNMTAFNEKIDRKEINPAVLTHSPENEDEAIILKKMPYIVLVIDELADLILSSQQEVETAITRIAQLARAVGIHMILATQRPSVDVITGVIKANFPARIAFQVASKVDSRTILDENGADKLLGRGDFLFMDPRKSKLVRAQGAWVQDKEIERVTSFIRSQRKAVYQEAVLQSQEKKMAMGDFKKDGVYEEAKRVILETGQASVSMVQRRLGVGYTRAARLIDMMEEEGVVGPYRGAKPREILVERPSTKKDETNA